MAGTGEQTNGPVASIMGGTLTGIQPQSTAQQSQNGGNPVTPDNVVPPADLFSGNQNVNLNNYFDQLKQQTSYAQLGTTPAGNDVNMQVISYDTPNVNDNTLKVIQQGIPTGKKANSGVGLPEDLGFGTKDIGTTIGVLNNYMPKLTEKDPVSAKQISTDIMQYQNAYKTAKASGDQNAAAEALAQLKFSVGAASRTMGNYLYQQDQAGLLGADAQKDMSHLYAMDTKAQDFKSYWNKDGASLQQYMQDAMTPIVRTYDAPASTLPSKQAKADLIANPRYGQMISQYQGTPAYDMLMTDMNQPTITATEKKFLSSIQPQISGLYDQYQSVKTQYGYNTAQTIYKDMLPMFDMLYYSSQTMLDDIITTMGQGIQNQTQSLYGDFISPIVQ